MINAGPEPGNFFAVYFGPCKLALWILLNSDHSTIILKPTLC